jgi:hypothetical protein
MAWRRKKTPAQKPRAQLPIQTAQGPQLVYHPDGSIEERSSAMGNSLLLPSTPARSRGVPLGDHYPGWLALWRKRHLGH